MFGSFQTSRLRIEVHAAQSIISDSLTRPAQIQQWLWTQQLDSGLPDQLKVGTRFTSRIGPIAIQHQVERLDSNCLRLLLSQGIDGFHEWYWGDGWLQSCVEGITILPLNLGQTVSLLNLRQFLATQQHLS